MKVLVKPKIKGEFSDEGLLQLVKTYARPLEETKFAETGESHHKNFDRDGNYIGFGPRYAQENSHLRLEHTWFGRVAQVTVDKELSSIIFEDMKGYENSAILLAADFTGSLMARGIQYKVGYQ